MPEARQVIPDARHEPTDIAPGFIWAAAALCLATLCGCALLIVWLYPLSNDRTPPMPLPLYPEPRLQPDPAADLENLRAREMQVLEGTGWVDETRGIAHVPIERAMRQVAREGIADWPVDAQVGR
jgi:hypothetical protein